jgi:hypothetical protein
MKVLYDILTSKSAIHYKKTVIKISKKFAISKKQVTNNNKIQKSEVIKNEELRFKIYDLRINTYEGYLSIK